MAFSSLTFPFISSFSPIPKPLSLFRSSPLPSLIFCISNSGNGGRDDDDDARRTTLKLLQFSATITIVAASLRQSRPQAEVSEKKRSSKRSDGLSPDDLKSWSRDLPSIHDRIPYTDNIDLKRDGKVKHIVLPPMRSTNGLLRNLSKPINSLRLLPNLSLHLHLSYFLSPESDSDRAGAAANQLESCADPALLPRLHSLMLRNYFLRSPFHWNALIRAYLRLVSPRAALLLFIQMSRSSSSPDRYTLPIIFKAISHSFMLITGRQLHSLSIKHGLELNEYCNSGLIGIYAKAGEFDHAFQVFNESSARKLGSWNAIINGLAQGGHSKEAIRFFVQLRRSGIVPDDVTMVSVASACGSYGDLSLAQQVHKCMLQAQSLERLSIMGLNSLVDMYSKCGRTDLALKVFDKMPGRDVSSWTSMIMGLATHGETKHALDHFDRMVREGVRPNQVTFIALLTACAHAGLADEAVAYFDGMMERYGIEPMVAHYGCMVDVLGRVGRVEEARKMVEGMPMRGNAVIWGTMLGACERHGKVEIGEWVAGKLLELEPWNDGVYVVLSNIYAACGMWAEVERVRRLMWERRVIKTPGYSAATYSN